MAKSIFMNDGEGLTAEEKISAEEFAKRQEEQSKIISDQQIADQKEKKMVTLEQLFSTSIEPREDRVLIFPDPVSEVTEGGIIKPQQAMERERPLFGTVIAVGPDIQVESSITNILLMKLVEAEYTEEAMVDIKKLIEKKASPLVVGMRVMYGRFAGTPAQDPATKTELLIMRPSDIFAKI